MTRPPSFTLPLPPRTLLPRRRHATPSSRKTFRWLDLPTELQLIIVEAVDERVKTFDGARGPSKALLHLSATARWFNHVCAPLVWGVIKFTPDAQLRFVDSRSGSAKRGGRSVRALEDIVKERGSALPVVIFSVERLLPRLAHDPAADDEHVEESNALVRILRKLSATSLKILSLDGVMFRLDAAHIVRKLILESPSLESVRLRRVDLTSGDLSNLTPSRRPSRSAQYVPKSTHVQALQILASAPIFTSLMDICSITTSLAYFPSSAADLSYKELIKSALPNLRHLSLGAKAGAHALGYVVSEILRLSDKGTVLPLEELVFAGVFGAVDLRRLVRALSKLPSLCRLSLDGLQTSAATAELVGDIAEAAPQLRALTLVAGSRIRAVEWVSPLDDYVDAFSKFRDLSSLMWNYAPTEHPGFGLSPGPHHDFTTGVKLGQACQALREAFFLTFIQDVRMRGIAVSYEDEVEGFSMWTETRFVSGLDLIYNDWMTIG